MKNGIRKLLICMLALICTLLIPNVSSSAAAGSQMKIHAIYLGEVNGDAVLLESEGQYLLMDCGDEKSYDKVKAYLQSLGVKELSIYISHFHGDHTAGLTDGAGFDKLTSAFKINKIYLPAESIISKLDVSWNYEKIRSVFDKKFPAVGSEKGVVELNVGDSFTVGDAEIEIIGPVNPGSFSIDKNGAEDDEKPEDTYENNCSLVARVTCGTTTYLTAGDCKEEGEAALVKKYGSALKADIYKMSHHGMPPANTDAFIDCVQPKVSFATNGGATELVEYGTEGKKHRKTYPARYACSQYGFVYTLGEEKKSLIIDVNNDVINMYRQGTAAKINTPGWAKVFGSDGVYEKYDYYYFDKNGKLLTGAQTIDGKVYYLGTGGCREAGTYVMEKGVKVYKGWKNYELADGKTERRYFAKDTDVMAVGLSNVEGKYYYFEKDGDLILGDAAWTPKKLNGKYYAIYTSGLIKTSGWMTYSGGRRYFGKTGEMATGWLTLSGKKYYLNSKSGYCATGVTKVGSNTYSFSDYGSMHTNKWVKDSKGKRYFGKDGKMATGWLTLSGKKYYLNSKNGYAATGKASVGGKYYLFSDAGALYTNKMVTDKKNKTRYADAKGRMLVGFQTIKGKLYYFDKDGVLLKGDSNWKRIKIGKYYYAVYKSGTIKTSSWRSYKGGGSCYFDAKGRMCTGWKKIDGAKYYLDPKTGYRATGVTEIDKKIYNFSNYGQLQPNSSVKIGGKNYRFNSSGVLSNPPSVSKVKIKKIKASTGKVAVSWSKSSKADGYIIYCATSENGKYKAVAEAKKVKTTSGTIKGLDSGKTYYFKVVAYKKLGDAKVYSKDSGVKKIKVK